MKMDSSFEFDPEILDSIYKNQLQQLKDLTLKLDDTQDINLCRKWLHVFNKSADEEKVSRNCLCVLLCQQLKTDGTLSLPFTDLSNCNRNLAQVLGTLDKAHSSTTTFITTTTGWQRHELPDENFQVQENEIIQLKQELLEIRNEMRDKNAQIEELNKVIQHCNQCSMEHDVYAQISKVLASFKRDKNLEQLFLFSKLFAEKDNLDLNEKLIELDKEFQAVLQEILAARLMVTQKQMTKIIKSREKRLKSCEEELKTQKWQHKIKTKVAKLQFCSILSRIFIKSREQSQAHFMELLDGLETKYKNIILKFTEGLPYDLPAW